MAVGLRLNACLFYTEVVLLSLTKTNIPDELKKAIQLIQNYIDDLRIPLKKYKIPQKRMQKLWDGIAAIIRKGYNNPKGLSVCLSLAATMTLTANINYSYKQSGVIKEEWLNLEEMLQELYFFYDPEGKETELLDKGEQLASEIEALVSKL